MSQRQARRPRCRPRAASGICSPGIAEIVTDPALTAEPLATPGVVVKHSRGTTSEQIAALPDRKTTPAPVANDARKSQRQTVPTKKAAAPRRAPKPGTAKLDAAEEARDTNRLDYDRKVKAIASREAALARERRDLERQREHALQDAENDVDEQRRAYDVALRKWRG